MAHPIGMSPVNTPAGGSHPPDLSDPRCLPADLDPLTRDILDRAARTIRLRPESTRIVLQWKTARRLRTQQQQQRRAA